MTPPFHLLGGSLSSLQLDIHGDEKSTSHAATARSSNTRPLRNAASKLANPTGCPITGNDVRSCPFTFNATSIPPKSRCKSVWRLFTQHANRAEPHL